MTQGILVLIGTLLGGVLVMINQHFQAKRDDRRQQRAFERDDLRQKRNLEMAVRRETLERIKLAIDTGVIIATQLREWSEGRANDSTLDQLIYEYQLALNGALVSAVALAAEQLKVELINLSALTERIAETIGNDTFKITLMGEAIDQLARVENEYTKLRIGG